MAITPEVRLTYVSVDEPKANMSGVLKYSVGILIPKTNKDAIDWFKRQIDAAIEKGIQKGKFNKAGSQNPTFKYPLRDGDAYYEIATDDKKDSRASYRGHMFVSASSNDKPGIVDRYAKPIFEEGAIYSGVWAMVDCNFFPFNNSGSIGVGCGLNNIMKRRDDDRLDGRSGDATSAFASVADTEPAGDDDLQ